MREIANRIIEYLAEQGVDSVVFMTFIGLALVLLTLRKLGRWSSMKYYEKWSVVGELVGSGVVALVGVVLLLVRLMSP